MFPSRNQTLGHYRLLGLIGRGGMGEVFRAYDTRLRRDVAIKILRTDPTGDDSARRRLLREARAAAALGHPSIVTIYSVEELENRCFIVMELVEGHTLADRLATAAFVLSEICEIGAQVADALAAAHANGIVHHDVTPRNILLTADGRVKLADFGLSRTVEPQDVSLESTRTGPQIAGTAYYMSPEQARGELCTPRTDLFSLGSVLYHAATGRRPFEGGNHFAVLNAILSVDPPPPSAIRTGVPPAFDALVGRLLEKRVEDRDIDALQVAGVLRNLSATVGVSGHAAADLSPAATRERAPFVGRARELTQLSAALSRSLGGEGATVVIAGDAGMGKTALVDAFLRVPETLAVNALVCRGQSVEYSGAGEAYMPVIDALAPMVSQPGQGLHDFVGTHAPTWQAQFPGVYPREEITSVPATPARLARELGDALSAAARSRPVVMILEDMHWADPSTAELLRHLAHRARRVALLIVVTCRAEEPAFAACPGNQVLADLEARGICEMIELSRLDEVSVLSYLQRRFDLQEVSFSLAALLSKVTEGHPLFLVSLVHLFIQRGDLQRVGDRWHLTTPAERLHLVIPRTVQAVIRRKLAALDETDRRLLQYASVEGQEFSTAVLSVLAGIEPAALEERLDRMAKGSRVVKAVGPERYADGTWGARYEFAHGVYQNVVYDQLTPSGRAELHRQVAERLMSLHSGRTTPIAAQLARHFKEGRDPARAFEHYVQAAVNSMTLAAALEAEAHYSEAIALANSHDATIEPSQIARAHYKRAITRVRLGNPLAALIDCREALITATDADDDDFTFDVRLLMAYAHISADQIDQATKVAVDIERTVEPPPGGRKRLSYLILDQQLKMGRGDLDDAEVTGDHAIARARALRDAERLLTSLCVRAQLHYDRAEYASAMPILREVSELGIDSLRRGDPRPVYAYLSGTVYLGLTLGHLGEVSEALATLQSGLEIARADGYDFWTAHLLNAIGWLFGEIGTLDAAMQYIEEAVAESAGQDTEMRVTSRCTLASACLRTGLLDRAASLLIEVDAMTRRDFGFAWVCRIQYAVTAAEDALVRGASGRATELAEKGNALSRQYGMWRYVVNAERLLAEAAAAERNWARARAHLQQSFDVLRTHPIPIVEWNVHLTASRIYRLAGLRADAASSLRQARSLVRQLSDRIQEEPLRETFLNSFHRLAGQDLSKN